MKKLITAPKSRRRKMAARLAKQFKTAPPEEFGANVPIQLQNLTPEKITSAADFNPRPLEQSFIFLAALLVLFLVCLMILTMIAGN